MKFDHSQPSRFDLDKPITIALLAFLLTVFISRIIAYLIIDERALPQKLFVSIDGYRLHHFVYGNALIVILSFLIIILQIKVPPRVAALLYGIGLGLIIDEFALWSGAITYLSASSRQIFNGINIGAVIVMTIILLTLLLWRGRKSPPV